MQLYEGQLKADRPMAQQYTGFFNSTELVFAPSGANTAYSPVAPPADGSSTILRMGVAGLRGGFAGLAAFGLGAAMRSWPDGWGKAQRTPCSGGACERKAHSWPR